LSADVAQQYGISLGQQFSVTTASGQTLNLVYDDSPRQDLTGIINIFDPNSLLTNGGDDNNFESSVTSVTNGGMVTTGNGEIAFPMFSMNPTTWGATLVEVVAYLLSILALTMMFIMTIIQNIAYLLMIAISPIMISFMLLRRYGDCRLERSGRDPGHLQCHQRQRDEL
jgi:type IV secretory pathway VirB6-like protein